MWIEKFLHYNILSSTTIYTFKYYFYKWFCRKKNYIGILAFTLLLKPKKNKKTPWLLVLYIIKSKTMLQHYWIHLIIVVIYIKFLQPCTN